MTEWGITIAFYTSGVLCSLNKATDSCKKVMWNRIRGAKGVAESFVIMTQRWNCSLHTLLNPPPEIIFCSAGGRKELGIEQLQQYNKNLDTHFKKEIGLW